MHPDTAGSPADDISLAGIPSSIEAVVRLVQSLDDQQATRTLITQIFGVQT